MVFDHLQILGLPFRQNETLNLCVHVHRFCLGRYQYRDLHAYQKNGSLHWETTRLNALLLSFNFQHKRNTIDHAAYSWSVFDLNGMADTTQTEAPDTGSLLL